MRELVLIGGGGHCKACIDVIEQEARYKIIGILDKPGLLGQQVLGYKVIGTDNDLSNFRQAYFLITIGQIKNSEPKKRICQQLVSKGLQLATIISPKAYVSRTAVIGAGTIVMHHAVVNSSAKIADNNIINTGAIIEHETSIGSHCHISTSSVVNGGCKIGNGVFVGSNAVIANQIKITDDVIIGAGSVVVNHLLHAGIYVGNPAKIK